MVVHQESIVRGMWEAFAKQHLDKGLMNQPFFYENIFHQPNEL